MSNTNDNLPPELGTEQRCEFEAEEARIRTLPRGWNAVKDLVYTGKRYVWVYYVAWFPKAGHHVDEGLIRTTKFEADKLAYELNLYKAKPAWL